MTLRSRLLLSFAAILVLALGINWFVVANIARRTLVNDSIARATALADLLDAGSTFARALPEKVEEIVGGQMLVQAALTAHLVDIAENHAGLTSEEIIERLKNVTQWTSIDEFWVTDEAGFAYIRNRDDVEFTFPEEPTERGQGHEFRFLLDSRDGSYVQRSMPRELDDHIFKYAAVSGIDKARIVQVGYMAESLREIIDGMHPGDLLDGVVGHGGILRIMVLDDDGEIQLDAQPGIPWTTSGRFDDEDVMAALGEAFSAGKTIGLMRDDVLAVVYPRSGEFAGTALVGFFDASAVRSVTVRITLYMAMAAGILFVIGALFSFHMSHLIADPIRELAAEAELIGQGDLDRSVEVKAGGEVGVLTRALNNMVGSLKTHVEQLREATATRQRMETELRVAAQVQMAMFPRELPGGPDLQISAFSDPARVVGGDFFDIMALPDGRLAIMVGDASGKGLPAALFATQCLSMLRALTLNPHDELRPALVLEEVNSVMLETCHTEELFVTMFYGIFDPAERSLTFGNAAHLPPILINGEKSGRIEYAASLPMGILLEFSAEEQTMRLSPGETLLLYTDGVTEADNGEGDLFGFDRLIEAGREFEHLPADQMVARIRDRVNGFSASDELADDMTIVALRII